MKWHRVALDALPALAWRNGGGVTRELLAWPGPSDWKLRVSVADIAADGPFSAYPGVERWFAVLEGSAVRLRVAEDEHLLGTDSLPLRFDGAAPAECRLTGGPTRDFNLMAPPGRAILRRLAGPQRIVLAAPSIAAVYVHAQAARVTCGLESAELPPGTFAWLEAGPGADVQVQATEALWMEFRR